MVECARAAAVLLAVVVLPTGSPASAGDAALDPAVVGAWERPVPLGQFTGRWIWQIDPDGAYGFSTDPPNIVPSHQGRAGFAQGQWWLQAKTGQPGWADGGSYRMEGPDTFVTQGRLGFATWHRIAAAPDSAASPDGWPTTVPAMATAAAAIARQWRGDAILVEVDVDPTPESFQQYLPQDEHSFTFIFWSPTDQSRLLITPYNPAGETFEGGTADYSRSLPIPETFLDFPEAVAQAQAMGLVGEAARAMLAGDDAGLLWTIWPTDADRTFRIEATPGAPAATNP